MWDVASGDKIFTAKHTNLVFCGAFDTLATRIVTGGGRSCSKGLGSESNKGPVATLRHKDRVYKAAFDPTASRVTATDSSGVWDVAFVRH